MSKLTEQASSGTEREALWPGLFLCQWNRGGGRGRRERKVNHPVHSIQPSVAFTSVARESATSTSLCQGE